MQWTSIIFEKCQRLFQSSNYLVVVLYLAVIGVPAVALVYLGFAAFNKQRMAIGQLTSANLVLAGERLASEVERDATGQAEYYLAHPTMLRICSRVHDLMSLAEARTIRMELEEFSRIHNDVAEQFYVWEDGHLVFPLLEPPKRFGQSPTRVERNKSDDELPDQMTRAIASNDPKVLRAVWGLVAAGTWEITATQLERFAARVREQTGSLEPSETLFTRHFAIARLLEHDARVFGRLRAAHAYPLAFPSAGAQLFYGPAPARPPVHERIFLFIVNKKYAETLFGGASIRTGVRPRAKLIASRDDAGVVQIRFPVQFPFWRIALWPSDPAPPFYAIWLFPLAMAAVVFSFGTGMAFIIRDRLRQARLIESQAEFVGGVSHEFRTPLTAIRMYADMLRYKHTFTESERSKFYETIAGEAERLNRLVERVLDVSRIDRGQHVYRFTCDDLEETVSGIVEAYKEYCHRYGYALNAELCSDLPPVRHDPHAITQAVLNLLENAIKFSEKGKPVGVALRHQSQDIVLEVRDRGPGIPSSERSKIFEEFYRGTTATSKGGYGIGLYVVRHIMTAHHGTVEVESELGQGSTFRLRFPLYVQTPDC
jgi:signal transduction histidine kinase